MTLVALWRDSTGVLHAASDSRVSFGLTAPPADIGVKLGALDVAIFGTTPQDGEASHLLDYSIGIATVGSVVTTHLALAALRQSLRNLQTIEPADQIAMEELAQAACNALGTVATATCNALFENGIGEILLLGYCFKAGQGRAFLIQCPSPATAPPSCTEVCLSAQSVRFYGSGAATAQSLAPTGMIEGSAEPLRILREIIDDAKTGGVGGAIQYGRLDPHRFEILAVRNFAVDHAHKTLHIYYSLGGLPMEISLIEGEEAVLFRKVKIIDPFRDLIDEYVGDGFHLL